MTKFRLIFTALLVVFASLTISAQQLTEANNSNEPPNRQNRLAKELGLSPDQMTQIRAIRQRTAQSLRQARQNFQLAKRELDEAIYADKVSEEDLQLKLRRVSEAQTQVTKTQAMREYAVRKVLKPDQLKRFRALRKKFRMRNGNKRRLNQNQRRRNNNRRQNRNNRRNKPADQQRP